MSRVIDTPVTVDCPQSVESLCGVVSRHHCLVYGLKTFMNCAMAARRLYWIELRLTDSYSVYLFYCRVCAMNNANATVSSPQNYFRERRS